MGDIFQELNEDIRKDRIKSIWDRYKVLIILSLVLILGGVGLNSIWLRYNLDQMEERSEKYFMAMDLVNEDKLEGLEALRLFSEEEKDSVPQYSLIASFNEAAIRRSKNDFYGALDIYNEIIKENIQGPFKDYASIQSAEILMELKKLNEAKNILSNIIKTNSSFALIGQEYLGYIAIYEKNFNEANKIFYELLENAAVPGSIKNRVNEILATLK